MRDINQVSIFLFTPKLHASGNALLSCLVPAALAPNWWGADMVNSSYCPRETFYFSVYLSECSHCQEHVLHSGSVVEEDLLNFF